MRIYCEAGDCSAVAERVGEDGLALCSGHRKQMQRRGYTSPLQERPKSARERLFVCALELRDADSDDDGAYDRAERRFWSAYEAAKLEDEHAGRRARR